MDAYGTLKRICVWIERETKRDPTVCSICSGREATFRQYHGRPALGLLPAGDRAWRGTSEIYWSDETNLPNLSRQRAFVL